MAIRIDQLSPTSAVSLDQEFPVMNGGITRKLKLQQVQALFGVGIWKQLPAMDLTGLSFKDFALPSTGTMIRFVAEFVPSAAGNVALRGSRDGGLNFLAGAADYNRATLTHNGTSVSATAGADENAAVVGLVSATTIGPHLIEGIVFPGNTTDHPRWRSSCVLYDTTNKTRQLFNAGHVTSVGQLTALRLLITAGTFTRGRLHVEYAE